MTKPHIVCHMMMSVDGRIDCAMTEKLKGVCEYFETLDALDAPTRVSGRVTAELEMAAGPWTPAGDPAESASLTPLGESGFHKAQDAEAYEVVFDTRGTLAWNEGSSYEKPLVIVVCEQVAREYVDYLAARGISWIACGDGRIDVPGAVEVLAEEFGVRRMATVGGGHINAAFLDAGLLDEVSVLIGPGIDARAGMASTFDGLPHDREPFQLKLTSCKVFDDGAVWLRYDVL